MQGKNKKFQMFILYTQKMRLINNIYTHSKKKKTTYQNEKKK